MRYTASLCERIRYVHSVVSIQSFISTIRLSRLSQPFISTIYLNHL